MTTRHDYSCEILALIVLTVLSALSHFWYIMIAICIITSFAAVGFILSRIFLRPKSATLARLLSPEHHKSTSPDAEVSVDIARRARSSLPVA